MRALLASHDPHSAALLDADRGVEITYGELRERVGYIATILRTEWDSGLVFQVSTNTIESVEFYLACLEAGSPVCLIEPGPAERWLPLIGAFSPNVLALPRQSAVPAGMKIVREMLDGGAYRLAVPSSPPARRPVHPDLALLLTTSGSTGNPKLVRLTQGNLLSNARSIVTYLEITPGDRSIQSLPMHYSFGLSLINSHLFAGACVVLTSYSFLQRDFWRAFDHCRCTAFAGVPYVFETLHRLHFDPKLHPTLRVMTQAGGALRPDLIQAFYESSCAAGTRFFVMYGQTEATARIAYVPWEQLGNKVGSIGIAIPAGRLWLDPIQNLEFQELVYSGPNVMMGYAEDSAGLAAGDELGGILRTGDLATADADGFFTLRGRLKRFAKLFGKRINLEDIERDLEQAFPLQAVVLERVDGLHVYAAVHRDVNLVGVTLYLARKLNVPARSITAEVLDDIPLTPSGKKDYRALQS
jgi:long-chain acyl-CoA synthetase